MAKGITTTCCEQSIHPFGNRRQFSQQFLIGAKSFEGSVERTGRFGEHQRERASRPLQCVRDIALMLIDFHEQVSAMVFTR